MEKEKNTQTTLLIIDDEAILRDTIAFYFEDKDFCVIQAQDGREGIHMFRECKPDVVLCDLRMPEVDGLEVVSTITREDLETPTIVISGTGVIEDSIEAMRCGAWDYVTKPIYAMQDLEHIIDKSLERAKLLKENRRYHEELEAEVAKRTGELKNTNTLLSRKISELETTQGALKKSEERLELALKGADLGAFDWNVQTGELIFDDRWAEMLGYKKSDLVSSIKTWEQHIHPDDYERIMSNLNDYLKGLRADFREEYRMKTKNGAIIWVQLQGKIVDCDRNGKPLRMAGTQWDITELKKAEEEAETRKKQLMLADKMASLGILVSGVAHEINNPNNFIMMNTPFIQDVWESTLPLLDKHFEENGEFQLAGMPFTVMRDQVPVLLDSILQGSERIKRIVAGLKNYARQDPGVFNEDININDISSAALMLLKNMTKKSTNNLIVEYGRNMRAIKGNGQQIEQVFINLIQNACQALENKNQKIIIRTECNDEEGLVRFEIEDEGTGISEEQLLHITDPFYTTKRDIGGTGLGLSISAGIIKDHEGEMRFASEINKGTKVTVELPLNVNR